MSKKNKVTVEENTVEVINENESSQTNIEAEKKKESGNKAFRGLLTVAVSVLFVVFVYLLIYFCENTGA